MRRIAAPIPGRTSRFLPQPSAWALYGAGTQVRGNARGRASHARKSAGRAITGALKLCVPWRIMA
eukprot:3015956-Rhodomonas_salina.1